MVNQLEQHNHLGQVLAAGWRAINNNPRCTASEMRAAMEAAGRAAAHRLERYLPRWAPSPRPRRCWGCSAP
jgi:biopolymer transport protein ExbB